MTKVLLLLWLLSLFYSWGVWGIEEFRNWPEVAQSEVAESGFEPTRCLEQCLAYIRCSEGVRCSSAISWESPAWLYLGSGARHLVFIIWFCVGGEVWPEWREAGENLRCLGGSASWTTVCRLWEDSRCRGLSITCVDSLGGESFSSFLCETWLGASTSARPERVAVLFWDPSAHNVGRRDILTLTPRWTSLIPLKTLDEVKMGEASRRIGCQLMGWSEARKRFRGYVTHPGDLNK